MRTRHVLILGGTSEARQLALRLASRSDLRVTLSLAGRTKDPLPQAGTVRVGGFGGAEGLERYLREERVDILLDATHPFAARISRNATLAARAAGVTLVVLDRHPWEPVVGDRWTLVNSMVEAVVRLGEKPRTVFLAIGRQELAPFAAAPQHRYIIRSVEPVAVADMPPNAACILGRGPFDEGDERALMERSGVDVLVARNSGGGAGYGKLAAARALGIEVVMIERPSRAGVPRVFSIDEATAALDHATAAERGE